MELKNILAWILEIGPRNKTNLIIANINIPILITEHQPRNSLIASIVFIFPPFYY